MNRIFWIGTPFFAPALSRLGWQVALQDIGHADLFGWQDVVAAAGWEPDVVVVGDKSRPPFLLGMEDFPCLTVFYCVDSHIHGWYPFYAQGFDVCLMSLKDHIPSMYRTWLRPERVWWSPPFSNDADMPGEYAPLWEVLFVGTVDRETTPRRHAFFRRLRERLPSLHVTRGDYRSLYPRARIVLNYCEFGDLNFRVFEALGCGACLVTPRVRHGLEALFTPGRDLLLYELHGGASGTYAGVAAEVDAACGVLEGALADESHCRSIAAQGLALVNAGHKAAHRAEAFTRRLEPLLENRENIIAKRMRNAARIRESALKMLYLLHAQNSGDAWRKKAYLQAATGAFTTS